jgi:cellulose biosynthesis protein BcsQ
LKTVTVFNNKGGVGKTTLLCNLAAYLSIEKKLKVLVVDCDPQCNTTQLIMGEKFASEFYWNPDASIVSGVTTIRDVLAPISDGDADVSSDFKPIDASQNRFRVDLIPGHPTLSFLEDKLSAAWAELSGGELGGYRRTNWTRLLVTKHATKYDLVLFDVGPSLGSLNRSVLFGCDRFITPMGSDIFSILGVRNIAKWLTDSIKTYEHSLQRCDERSPGGIEKFSVPREPSIVKGFSGYTINQYITKSKGGVRIATDRYEEIISKVPDEINANLGIFRHEGIKAQEDRLGVVPHLYSLIPLAQTKASPILALEAKDGLVGSHYRTAEVYGEILSEIAANFLRNLQIAE